jgi:Fe2+ or Zn2+ uptake regulation protein
MIVEKQLLVVWCLPMRTPEELTELFRSTGRKVTAQRQCIFRLLKGNETHPSAESIHAEASREMETISLKTVYQTLHDLAELGEIASLDVGTGMTRFDPNVDHPHHHLVCRQCGRVRDLVADFPDLRIPKGADLGFDVGSAEIVFRGLCPECRPSGRRRARTPRNRPALSPSQ